MRYEIFIIKPPAPGGEEQEEILGSVIATDPEEAKLVAVECLKGARGKKLMVRVAAKQKGVWT